MTETIRDKPARASFEAKVVLLEQYSAAGAIPKGTPVLRLLKDVIVWEDSDLGLSRWTSFSIAAPSGPNADLRNRLDIVLPEIVTLQSGGRVTEKKPRRGKIISRDQLEREHERLAIQNNLLLRRQDQLEGDVARLKHTVAEREQEIAELVSKLNTLTRFPKP